MTSIETTRSAITSGQSSAVEWTESCLKFIDARDTEVNAYLAVDRDGALRQAAAIDARVSEGGVLPALAGVPMGLKDVLCVEGMQATAGSKILEGYIAPYSG